MTPRSQTLTRDSQHRTPTRRWSTTALWAATLLVAGMTAAACDKKGPSAPSGTFTVTGPPVAAVGQSVQLTARMVVDGAQEDVTAAASWTSANLNIATVSNTGLVTTLAVGDAEIRVTYQGALSVFRLGVQASPLLAQFTVSSPTAGPDACGLVVGGAGANDCVLDGSTSIGQISVWRWTLETAGQGVGPVELTTPFFTPITNCSLFATKLPAQGPGYILLTVRLVVRDTEGRSSPETITTNVQFYPRQQCGYTF